MATIGPTTYADYGLKAGRSRHLKILAGGRGKSSNLAEGDIILHGMERVFAAVVTYAEDNTVDEQLYVDLSTAGQVTITDLGGAKECCIIIVGQ